MGALFVVETYLYKLLERSNWLVSDAKVSVLKKKRTKEKDSQYNIRSNLQACCGCCCGW